MVSRRNFFSIIIMMTVLFFMFQFTQVVKESGNRYDVNEFVVEEGKLPSGANKWQPMSEEESTNVSLSSNDYVLYFGDKKNELGKVISQWCKYTKRELLQKDALGDYVPGSNLPELILLDAANLDLGVDCKELLPVVELGVPVVFCNLPDVADIEASDKLQKILGIREVRARETEVLGIRVFDGFLVGGEAVYEPKTQEDFKRLDLDLTIPWYTMASGTKTYMVGMMDEEVVEREEFPSLIWRNTYESTKIFSVEGEYMSSLAGLGILDAFTYELNDYEIYPIINAQNVSVANFPGFSTENSEEIMRLYSRTPQLTFQDIMWPSISAMTETNDIKLTCFFSPQYNYNDGLEPIGSEVVFYLQQLKELGSEAGMALNYSEDSTFSQMLKSDKEFYDSLNSTYQYQAVYVGEKDLENTLNTVGNAGLLEKTKTIVCEYDSDRALVSYLSDNVTLQTITGNAEEYTYMDDLTAKSLQTALGYSNVLLDLHTAIWPEDTEDEWQNLYDTMSSNVGTYWSGNTGFAQTTLSESDLRVRTFLNLDYEDGRSKNTVVLHVNDFEDEAWFLLRTHDEKIVDIQGGEYQKIECNAYLIKVLEAQVIINVEQLTLEEMSEET